MKLLLQWGPTILNGTLNLSYTHHLALSTQCMKIMVVIILKILGTTIQNLEARDFFIPKSYSMYHTVISFFLDSCGARSCVCLHTHTHTHTHTHIHTYIHTYTHIHIHIHTYIRTYIHTRTHARTHTRTYIHTTIQRHRHLAPMKVCEEIFRTIQYFDRGALNRSWRFASHIASNCF